jgi:hypothetical protein
MKDKLQEVQQNLGHEPKRISLMINVSELWRKYKKWRKSKNEKVNDDSDGADDFEHNGDELRR